MFQGCGIHSRETWLRVDLTVKPKVICCHQKLEAELDRNLHIGHVLSESMLVPVVEVLDYFLEHHSAVSFVRLDFRSLAMIRHKQVWDVKDSVSDQV